MKTALILLTTTFGLSANALNSLSTTPSSYLISDAEAGYNQAQYDECVDSFDDEMEVDQCLKDFGIE